MELSPNADKIFKRKYARTLPSGKLEEWPQACVRVAEYVASAELREDIRLQMLAEFTKIMLEKTFLPGGRILANAGTNIKNLMNCFVLPIEDSREGIYDTLKKAAEIFARGGGIGYNFSNLREVGAEVKSTGGKASGPLSFMYLFDQTGEVISQASRRGAQMGILDIDHPDVVEFINYKSELSRKNQRFLREYQRNVELHGFVVDTARCRVLSKTLADNQLTHFNISVSVSDEFMKVLKHQLEWTLSNGKVYDAEYLMLVIAENAWESGDPGIFFVDRANEDNMVPYLGNIGATNPCGEVPLLPNEACCLGSINLERFVEDDFIDFDYIKEVVWLAIRFLDNVHTMNEMPIPEVDKAIKLTRRLGLGVMGWADMLDELRLPYDHEEAFILAEIIAKFIQTEAWKASMELAQERGDFLGFQRNNMNWNLIDKLELPRERTRNVAVTSIAPTGSISLLCDVNSGIEPYFARDFRRNITYGVGNTAKEIIQQTSVSDSVKTAHEIHWRDHIKMQAAWQRWTCNAVSKTINMPHEATVEDIIDAYKLAWELGCKGITVYRDGSRLFQILEARGEGREWQKTTKVL